MKKELRLLFFGWLQVFMVALQTWFLANSFYPGVAFGGFMISFVWTFNVKSVAFGGNKERFIYSIGAMIGAVTGLFTGKAIL